MSGAGGQDLDAFVEAVGSTGAVTVVGGRTQWSVGGMPVAGVREVRAPQGIVAYEPAEMTVRVGAGTTVAAVNDELAKTGQMVCLPEQPGGTVGGALAVGRTDHRRLGRGPVRDALLEARVVTAEGRPVKCGGPTVKNVSGYDLCRLLVGSLGTLGCIGEVVLRTKPRPEAMRWFEGPADPFELRAALLRPASILWDGDHTWLLLEGTAGDVELETTVAERAGLRDGSGPPPLPPHRWSVDPASMRALTGEFVAEVGVGIVHRADPSPPRPATAALEGLHARIKAAFDPTGRFNPGRSV